MRFSNSKHYILPSPLLSKKPFDIKKRISPFPTLSFFAIQNCDVWLKIEIIFLKIFLLYVSSTFILHTIYKNYSNSLFLKTHSHKSSAKFISNAFCWTHLIWYHRQTFILSIERSFYEEFIFILHWTFWQILIDYTRTGVLKSMMAIKSLRENRAKT